jgi:Rps23 Pro-64 3,4-dihydroxylase Tpa1-like proline 4-hydroxylase
VDIVPIDDPKFGIFLYKNMLPKELNLINRLEAIMEANKNNQNSLFQWMPAMVGDGETIPDYRDCFDFKIVEKQAALVPTQYADFRNIFFEIKKRLYQCLDDYQKRYNINMEYMEAINFVKYGPGQHFSVHADHGYSYVATVSSVMYLNNEYEGGELFFPYFDLTIKPDYGDIIFFPSAFIYAHASLPVKSGTKYAAVTMFDYNDRAHQHHMFNGK